MKIETTNIINDIANSQNKKSFTEIVNEFQTEIQQFENSEISEIELYEIISIAIDFGQF